ncbi:MAG: hypothetical protein U5K31_13055 [Balneolaceae bacterium]|nr:hypothetical protein [Balneolaceae bacterium]
MGDSLVGVVFSTPVQGANLETERPSFLVTYDREGEVQVNPLLTGPGSELMARRTSTGGLRITPRPFGRESLFRRGPDSFVYSAWTGEFRIRRHHPRSGTSESIIEQEFKPSPVTEAQFDSVRNSYPNPDFLESFDTTFHTHWPALEQFLVDDQNRIWVHFRAGDGQYRNLWAFEHDGSIVNIIDHNVTGSVALVRNGKIHTLHMDGDRRPVIRRYAIVEGLN